MLYLPRRLLEFGRVAEPKKKLKIYIVKSPDDMGYDPSRQYSYFRPLHKEAKKPPVDLNKPLPDLSNIVVAPNLLLPADHTRKPLVWYQAPRSVYSQNTPTKDLFG